MHFLIFVAHDSAPITFELVFDFIHVMLCYAIVEDTNACLFEKKIDVRERSKPT